jgi:hypothetical protein
VAWRKSFTGSTAFPRAKRQPWSMRRRSRTGMSPSAAQETAATKRERLVKRKRLNTRVTSWEGSTEAQDNPVQPRRGPAGPGSSPGHLGCITRLKRIKRFIRDSRGNHPTSGFQGCHSESCCVRWMASEPLTQTATALTLDSGLVPARFLETSRFSHESRLVASTQTGRCYRPSCSRLGIKPSPASGRGICSLYFHNSFSWRTRLLALVDASGLLTSGYVGGTFHLQGRRTGCQLKRPQPKADG